MIDSQRLTPAATPEAADPAAAAGLGWPRAQPCASRRPRAPAPAPESGRGRGVVRCGAGVDLQPRRADSGEITSTGKPTPKAQTGRGPERGERNGGRGRPASTARAGWAPETVAMPLPALCPPLCRQLNSWESWVSLAPADRCPARPPRKPRAFSTRTRPARERCCPTARGAPHSHLWACLYAVGSKRNLDTSSQRSPEKPRNP